MIDVCVGTLRRKLEAAGAEASILSVRKVGFRFVEAQGPVSQVRAAIS